jgi:hypothetical protein
MVESLTQLVKHKDLESQRQYFRDASYALATLFIGFKDLTKNQVFLFRCPTAFNKTGAYWIEKTRDLKNPYLGKRMISCGELIATFPLEGKSHHPKIEAEGNRSHSKHTSGASEGSASKHEAQHKASHVKPPVHNEGSHTKTE